MSSSARLRTLGVLLIFVAVVAQQASSAVSPFTQQAYLHPSNVDPGDLAGSSVAISGDTMVVGAYGEASNGSSEANNSLPSAGAAYVFVRDGSGVWTQQARLKAPSPARFDSFSFSVAISGDTIVVGAQGTAFSTGAAYVFVRSGTSWSLQASLSPAIHDTGDNFGWSVAINGDTVIVGAVGEDGNGINGEADNSLGASGAAYIFTRTGTIWTQQAYLKADNADVSDQFGNAVAVSGDTALVGARYEASSFALDPGDNSTNGAGAAYAFVRDGGGNWTQQAYLKAPQPALLDQFAFSLSLSGDYAVVSAPNDDGADGSLEESGAAYVFERSGNTWSAPQTLYPSNPDSLDGFGLSVAIEGDRLIISGPGDDSDGTSESDNSADLAGAVYVFSRGEGTWSQTAYLKASPVQAADYFGYSVGLSNGTIAVGALGDAGTFAGAAYVFVPSAVENAAPIADAGSDVEVNTFDAPGDILLSGSGSDADLDTLTYTWRDASNVIVATTASATLTRMPGSHIFTLTVDDGHGGSATDSVTVDVYGKPLITWPQPAPIAYGTALSATQLNASVTFAGAPVDGIGVYAPEEGSVLNPGSNTLAFLFAPLDSYYRQVSTDVQLDVRALRVSGTGYNAPEGLTAYRGTLTINAENGTPSGTVSYNYTRTRMTMTGSVTAVSISGATWTISGTANVGGPGYTFTATVVDGAPDRFGLVINKPNGTLHFSAPLLPLVAGSFAAQTISPPANPN